MILFGGIACTYLNVESVWLRLGINTALIVIYLSVVVKKELPLRHWPLIGKYFRKS